MSPRTPRDFVRFALPPSLGQDAAQAKAKAL